jgi:hypothetical protein
MAYRSIREGNVIPYSSLIVIDLRRPRQSHYPLEGGEREA